MLRKILNLILESEKIALFHHINPDGDTLSSSYGLALALKKRFPSKEIKVVGNYEELSSNLPFSNIKSALFTEEIDENWLAIVGDTSNLERIEKKEMFLKAGKTACFDHHTTEPNYKFNAFWSEPNWIASTLQALEIVKKLKIELDEEIAYHLMIGIITDSGQFSFSLADPRPVKAYAYLLEYIENKTMDSFFYEFKKKEVKDLEIEAFILNQIKFSDSCVFLKVTNQNLKELGIDKKQIKAKVNKLGNIEGFNVWALFIEVLTETQVYIKGSLRSNGPNVARVAEKYGGGGHVRAAGLIAQDWKEVDKIISNLNSISNIY
ncbi:MAG: bifunctional oligoribonuclease/PAP phosphatase NrnA [Mycoplasma sp.]|nr:bifunctional oligoribonuclease/PAP phosphatase NrnA [Mycoplasma sp.]